MELSLNLNGNAQILDSMSKRLNDMQGYWEDIGQYMVKQTVKERFDKEQSPEGKKWEKLSASRIKQRLRRHKSSGSIRILQDTGRLRRVNYKASRDNVKVGSNLEYAATHQYGRGKIPARPFLGINDKERQEIVRRASRYVYRGI